MEEEREGKKWRCVRCGVDGMRVCVSLRGYNRDTRMLYADFEK